MAINTGEIFEEPNLTVWISANQICFVKLREGDKEAFKALYRFYAPSLYGSIIRNLKTTVSPDAILEQTFLYAWQNMSTFDESKCKMFTWLNRIAVRFSSQNR